MTDTPRTPMRSDAEQNRARILDAARTAFTADGHASMQSIARQAGVGQGTLYRHFPNRESLLLAVYRVDVQALVDAAPVLLERHAPSEALGRWFEQLAAYGRIKHGVADAIQAATRADLAGEHYGPVTGALTALLDACKREGSVRADIDADDVLALVAFLWRTDPGPHWAERSRHLLGVVADGLRPRP